MEHELELLVDDAETLRAALEMIDSWEAEGLDLDPRTMYPSDSHETQSSSSSPAPSTTSDSSTSSSHPPSTLSSASPPPLAPGRAATRATSAAARSSKKAPSSTSSSNPRRDELVFLRRQVRELEDQLATLQAQTTPGQTAQAQGPREIEAAWVWRRLAARQLERRQLSEQENAKLRLTAESQLKLARGLLRMLTKMSRREDTDDSSSSSKRVKISSPPVGTAVTADEQLAHVMTLYEERELAFGAVPFVERHPLFRDVRLHHHPNGEARINVDMAWVVPFPLKEVQRVAWYHLATKYEQNSSPSQCAFLDAVDTTSDVLISRYISSASAQKFYGKLLGRLVARRFFDDEDCAAPTMIWDLRAEPAEFERMSMDGVHLHEEVFMRMLPHPCRGATDESPGSDSTNSSSDVTLIQHTRRVHIQFGAAETPTRRRRVEALTQYLFCQVEEEMNWKERVIEDLLMGSGPPARHPHRSLLHGQ